MALQSYEVTVKHHQLSISLDISKLQEITQELTKNPNPTEKLSKEILEKLRNQNLISINFTNLPHITDKYSETVKSVLALIKESLKKLKSTVLPKLESQAELTGKKVTFADPAQQPPTETATDKFNATNNSLISLDDNNNNNDNEDIFNTAIGEGIQQHLIDSDDDMPEPTEEEKKLQKIERYLKSMPNYKKDEITNFEDYYNELDSYFSLVGEKDDEIMINLVKHKVSKFRSLKMTLEKGYNDNKTFKKLMEYAVSVIDGKNENTDCQIYLQATKLKLATFNDAKKYFQAFVDLQAQATAQIDEKVLVEAFIDGVGIQ